MRRALLVLATCAVALSAQARNERRATVGMPARIEQIVLPGSELVAKPLPQDPAIVLRILGTWPHGTDRRYDLEYYGLEPGQHDLAAWLVRADASDQTPLPAILVDIVPVLPPGQVEPVELEAVDPPRLGGYTTMLWIGGVVWVIGLGLLLFAGRRRRHEAAAAAARPVTLADQLRPLVEAAAAGKLDDAGKARLERLLLAFWRRRLDLAGLKMAEAMARLRAHAEAGVLVRQLDQWLHRPDAGAGVDVSALLAPYQGIAAEEA